MDDIVLYDSVGRLIISLKYTLVRRIEAINTANNNINGENDTKIVPSTVPMDSLVSILESLNTSKSKIPTDAAIEEYASVFPATELEVNDLIVIIKTVMPPAMRE